MRQHVYIFTAEHEDYTQGEDIKGVYTSERKAKAAAREEAGVTRLPWEAHGSVKTHKRFHLSAKGPEIEDQASWTYTIHVVRPD